MRCGSWRIGCAAVLALGMLAACGDGGSGDEVPTDARALADIENEGDLGREAMQLEVGDVLDGSRAQKLAASSTLAAAAAVVPMPALGQTPSGTAAASLQGL